MRTEKEIKKDIAELDKKYDILSSDDETLFQYWEADGKLREELKTVQKAKEAEEYNSPEAKAERKRVWEQKQIKNISESGVGERYLSADINSYICETDEQKNNLKIVKQFISNPWGKNLWLLGVAGTGKTLLGAIICRYCGAKYIKSFKLKDELDYARNFNAKKNPSEVIDDFSKIPILIIDEVGRYKNPQEQEYLFRLLNERYEMRNPTVLISNMNKKEFGEYLGNPIVDRFREGCKSLEFTGETYRAKDRTEWNGEINDILFE